MVWLFLRCLLLREMMMGASRTCALDIGVWAVGESRQVMRTRLSSANNRKQLNQSRFAKRCPPGPKTSLAPYCATIFWRSVSAHFFPCLRFPDLINGILAGRAYYENNSTHTNQHRFNATTASPEQRQRKRSDAAQRSYYRGITGADAGGKPHLRAADQVLSRSHRCARPERDRWRSEFHH